MDFRCKFRVAILFLIVCNWGVRVVLTAADESINVKDVLQTIFGTVRHSDRVIEGAPSDTSGQDNFVEHSVQQSVENNPQPSDVLQSHSDRIKVVPSNASDQEKKAINVKDVLCTIFGTVRRSDRVEAAPSNASGQDYFAEDSVQQPVENIPQHLCVLPIDSTLLLNNARAGHMYLSGDAWTQFSEFSSITAEQFHRKIELETRGLMPPFGPSAGHDDHFRTGYDPPGVQWSNSSFQNLVDAYGSSDGREDAPSYALGEDYYARHPMSSEDPDPEDLCGPLGQPAQLRKC